MRFFKKELKSSVKEAEEMIAASFKNFSRNALTEDFMMDGQRYVFLNASGFGTFFHGLKFSGGQMTSLANYFLWLEMGKSNCQQMMSKKGNDVFKQNVFALFPFLAFSGRGKASILSHNVVASPEFSLVVSLNNSIDSCAVEPKQVAKGSNECKCASMSGFMSGWCSKGKERKSSLDIFFFKDSVNSLRFSCVGD